MTKRGRFHSLQVKFIIVLLLALAVGLACGATVKIVGDYSIEHIYLEEEASNERCREALDHFSQFVQEEQLHVDNAKEIVRWAKNQNHLYLMVEDKSGQVLVDSGWWDEATYYSAFAGEGDSTLDDLQRSAIPSSSLEEPEDSPEAASQDDSMEESFGYGMGSAPVEFADGTYLVSVYDFSDEPLYEIVTIATYAVSIAIFVFVMLWYHQSTIQQIIKLSREVEQIAGGNLEGHITVRNRDEIGVLAQHVDSMRYSIMREMRAEQEAWNANSDLITRMSHDIRTPLTVLLGFLELLDEGDFSQEEAYRSYLGICKKNAFQLKELADKLFQYFLVFGHRDCDLNLELTDARVLLDQLIGEHEVLLQEQGWQVENRRLESQVLVEVDPVYVKRLFDNLFSNIEKYADPGRPVSIEQKLEGDFIRVSLHNFVPHNPNPVESTNIGLKTCERIVQQLGGVFQYQKEETEFFVNLTIPVCHEPQNQTS
ncbi:MAG: histidine kinase dimerization/phospho-acceptor domain-containing protein [Candidatus Onthomonas sp.]